MLTKTDLQAIDNLFTRRLDEAITHRIDTLITKRIRQELKPVKKDISKIRKDMNLIVTFFDREYTTLRKRLEEHTHLPLISS